jgi:hypothetical protein
MIILFACLVGWLNSSPVEIQKKNKAQSAWAGMNKGMAPGTAQCTCAYEGHNPWHTLKNH